MKNITLLLITGIAVGALLAEQKKQNVQADPIDIIIEKSKKTMRKASAVSAMADKQVSESVSKMKQVIEVLEEQNEQLVEQVKVMEDEIVAIKSEPSAQPFDVLAIGVPDTADRK
jgi:predicted RNase H-like nuclease (RuvC/YqgF family)